MLALLWSYRSYRYIQWGLLRDEISPDLNSLNFFLWGYAKDNVYADNPRTLQNLKTAITRFIKAIPLDMCRRVIGNFAVRLNACLNRNGALILSRSCKTSTCDDPDIDDFHRNGHNSWKKWESENWKSLQKLPDLCIKIYICGLFSGPPCITYSYCVWVCHWFCMSCDLTRSEFKPWGLTQASCIQVSPP